MKGLRFNPVSGISNLLVGFLSKYSVQQEEVIGVDITPRVIRLMQLSKSGDKWTIEKLSYRHIEGIGDIRGNQKKISEEIQVALKSGKFSTTNAAISLPVSSSIIKVIPIPLMTDEEMKKAIEFDSLWENLTQLPGALEEYSIFYQIIRKDTSTNMMDVLFVASKLSDVNTYVDIVSKAGINPVVLDVRCFALRNAFETKKIDKKTDKPLAILEIGEFENYLLILKEENPYVSDIFVSAKDKEIIGQVQKSKDALSQIVDRYIMQIRQNLTTYASRFKTDKIDNLFIVSQSPNVSDLIEILSNKLKDITIVNFNPLSGMNIPAQVKEKVDAEDNKSSFTAAIGLATRKLDIFGYYKKVTGVKNINLLPNREIIKKSQRTKLISGILIVMITIAILSMTSYFGYEFYKSLSKNKESLTDYEDIKNQLYDQQSRFNELNADKQTLIDQLKLSETATTNQITAAIVLKDIAVAAGLNIALVEIKFDGHNTYVVKGEAISDKAVIHYISTIKENSIFSNAILEKSHIAKEGSNIKIFKAKLVVKEDLMKAKVLDQESIRE
jgi:type IV pilus assembly protein PilN|tara:strand:+ start:86 stop:1753 length:1668 start_codon:yes stop_codon:yes gene_type:complete